MSGASKTFDQLTFEDLPNVISSPGSEVGHTPYDSQDGPTIDRSGPDHAHAKVSARQAKEAGLMTSGTYGQHSSGSSSSAAPARLWANRLRARMDSLGSTLYSLTWKVRTTPQGRSIFALRASALRISDKGCTGVRTPSACDDEGGTMDIIRAKEEGLSPKLKLRDEAALFSGVPTPNGYQPGGPQDPQKRAAGGHMVNLQDAVLWFSGVPTPNAEHCNDTDANWEKRRSECKERTGNGNGFGLNLGHVASLFSGVPTPLADKNSPQQRDDFTPNLANVATLFSGINTPRATDGTKGGPNQANGALSHDASLFSGVATPQAFDSKDMTGNLENRKTKGGCSNLKDQVTMFSGVQQTGSGETQDGTSAETESTDPGKGRLNAHYSRWLQGYPPEWCEAAKRASRLLPKSRKQGR